MKNCVGLFRFAESISIHLTIELSARLSTLFKSRRWVTTQFSAHKLNFYLAELKVIDTIVES